MNTSESTICSQCKRLKEPSGDIIGAGVKQWRCSNCEDDPKGGGEGWLPGVYIGFPPLLNLMGNENLRKALHEADEKVRRDMKMWFV